MTFCHFGSLSLIFRILQRKRRLGQRLALGSKVMTEISPFVWNPKDLDGLIFDSRFSHRKQPFLRAKAKLAGHSQVGLVPGWNTHRNRSGDETAAARLRQCSSFLHWGLAPKSFHFQGRKRPVPLWLVHKQGEGRWWFQASFYDLCSDILQWKTCFKDFLDNWVEREAYNVCVNFERREKKEIASEARCEKM